VKWLVGGGLVVLIVAGALAVALGRGAGDGAQDGAALPAAASGGPFRGSEPPVRILLASFALRDVDGGLVRSRDLRGRIVLLTFLDSQCTESCPVIASQIARTLDSLEPAERKQVAAVAISTDPAEDTKASVRDFLRRNRALGKVHYLGGGEPVARLRAVWKRFMILSSHESGQDTLHSAPVRMYDRQGVWVTTLHPGADLTPANLAHDIRVALRG
jgi:protein SCO1/2